MSLKRVYARLRRAMAISGCGRRMCGPACRCAHAGYAGWAGGSLRWSANPAIR